MADPFLEDACPLNPRDGQLERTLWPYGMNFLSFCESWEEMMSTIHNVAVSLPLKKFLSEIRTESAKFLLPREPALEKVLQIVLFEEVLAENADLLVNGGQATKEISNGERQGGKGGKEVEDEGEDMGIDKTKDREKPMMLRS